MCTLGPIFEDGGDPDVLAAMTGAAFRRICGELAETLVEGLYVYWFGRRRQMTVRELLFYWQD